MSSEKENSFQQQQTYSNQTKSEQKKAKLQTAIIHGLKGF